MERGKYIVIEGADLSGKSKQAALLTKHLNEIRVDTISAREPGSTPMGEALRKIIKNKEIDRTARTNLWLFSAARADVIDKIIRPAYETGQMIVADRSWVSTLAYQGYGEGLSLQHVWDVTQLATENLMQPDRLIYLRIPFAEVLRRAEERGEDMDYFEQKGPDFYNRVDNGYMSTVRSLGAIAINGLGTPEEVHKRIWQHVEPLTEMVNNGI